MQVLLWDRFPAGSSCRLSTCFPHCWCGAIGAFGARWGGRCPGASAPSRRMWPGCDTALGNQSSLLRHPSSSPLLLPLTKSAVRSEASQGRVFWRFSSFSSFFFFFDSGAVAGRVTAAAVPAALFAESPWRQRGRRHAHSTQGESR